MRRLTPLFAAALALRALVAVVTEYKPIFPAYYYIDAVQTQEAAARLVATNAGPGILLAKGGLKQAYALANSLVYRIFGPRPLAAKLVHALIGALSIVVMAAALEPLFGAGCAAACAWACALWPSHVFFTSQVFKEGPTLLALWLLFWGATSPWSRKKLGAAAAGALVLSLMRPLLLGAFAAARAASVLTRKTATPAILVAALALGAAWRAGGATSRWFPLARLDTPRYAGVDPFTPQGLAKMRRLRQESDRMFAEGVHQREIASQLFYGQEFHGWLDVIVFMARSSFYVLFMPLPGLYPMEGKMGRMMAAGENLALLAVVIAAIAGLVALARRRACTREIAVLPLFFAVMLAGASLFEFDLGSASRHKIIYLPALFPFAFAALRRP